MLETGTARHVVWHDLDSPDPDRVLGLHDEGMGWRPSGQAAHARQVYYVPVPAIGDAAVNAHAAGRREP